ncbi:hypothetical protein DFJ67_0529 [Asanoa ferruginea]|uniref:Uncharacterized protein n=1 Tax=Asanoa ferruginea TaxID=53367 RepID=A0A3D9ZB93_9ACTN|nr:hypothetical protein [Asanoa ferruginea]REF94591.1 hypothetical protein DFJ67_0529 [Asanoa ferruginea]GIF50778.1 hypothetical protein Afe04nite_53170 [Asanoa ferruginea]
MASVADPWITERFGQHADTVARVVPQAIAVAVARQIEAHRASGLRTRHAYGGAWPAQYEELVSALAQHPGVEIVRPRGWAVHLVLLNGCLLVPFRFAEQLTTGLTDPQVTRKLNKSCRQLLGEFGPEATIEQPSLFEGLFPPSTEPETEAAPRLLGESEPDAIVLVVFAANEDAGLLRVGFAEAALPDNGDLQWRHIEWLPLPTVPGTVGVGRPVGVPDPRRSPGTGAARFDDAPLPEPTLDPRPAGDQPARRVNDGRG